MQKPARVWISWQIGWICSYEAIGRSLKGLKLGLTPDAVLTDVEEAMEAMGEVTGATVREDITARIFERFCVGK